MPIGNPITPLCFDISPEFGVSQPYTPVLYIYIYILLSITTECRITFKHIAVPVTRNSL